MIKSRLLLRRTRHVWSTILRLPHLPLLVLIPVLTLATYFFLSFLGTPHAPKLKNGSGDILYSASNKIFSTTIGTKSGESKISFSVGNAQANFVLAGASPVTAVKENNTTVLFPGVQKDTDLRYTTIPSGLKEELIVKAKPVSNVYLFDLLLKNVHPKQLTNNFIDPTFKDAKGNYLFHFEKPFAVDAKGVRTNNVLLQIGQDKQVADKYYLKLIVDESWLSDPDRAYPITIDPTIVHDTTAEFAAGQLNRVKDLASESSEDIVATGGTISHSGGYTIHTFTSSGTFTPTTSLSTLTLVVGAGGNGSGANWGGGGGGGCSETSETFGASAYTITVGTAPGGSSSIAGTGVSASATGGSNGNLNGGSSGAPTTYSGGAYDTNAGGGGAGCRGVGGNGWGNPPESGGNGGPGYTSAIDGLCYGGGGGGASGIVGVGSCGGATYSVSNARANSGGGGAGLGNTSGAAGTVIIRYPTTYSNGSTQLTTYYQELPTDQYTVGLWHMNEASGNALDSSGNSLTGTPTGTTVVSSLLNNARSFNGTSDLITVTDNSLLTLGSNFTVEGWVNMAVLKDSIFIGHDNGGGNVNKWFFAYNFNAGIGGTANTLTFHINSAATPLFINASWTPSANTWYHIAITRTGGSLYNFYVNGTIIGTTTNATAIPDPTANLTIGEAESIGFTNGKIDEIRLSSIARTPEQIKADASRRSSAVYTSSVLDLTTVAAWSPLTWSEHGVNTGDGETLKSSTSLSAQWNFNSTSGTTATNDAGAGTCGGTATNCDFTLNNFASTGSQDPVAAPTGWTSNNKRWGGGALMLNSVATADSLSVADPASNALDPNSADFTLETWVKTIDVSSEIFSNNNNNGTSCTDNGYRLGIDASGYPTFYLDTNGATAGCDAQITTSNKPINDGNWHHIAVSVIRGTGAYLYVDGILTGSDTTVTSYSTITVTGTVYLGGSAGGYDGVIDSTRIYSRALGSAEIASNYQAANIEFQTRVGADTSPDDGSWSAWSPTTGETSIDNMDNPLDYATPSASIFTGPLIATSAATLPVIEGNKSLQIQTGRQTSMTNVVGLWHLDETGGTGAYIKDSSANANNGTPTGTTVINGISSKGRDFNGSGDKIVIGDVLDFSGDFSIDAWVKNEASTGTTQAIVDKAGTAGSHGYQLVILNAGPANLTVINTANGNYLTASTTTNIVADNKWHHVVGTVSGTTISIYLDGALQASNSTTTGTRVTNSPDSLTIGDRNSSSVLDFNGKIDEVKISNVARSAEEVAESYRMGRDHYINKTISSTDLSGKSSLPFYVAADRPGSYLSATIGESAFANYQPDSSTVGLWHLDEQTGSGAYLKDSSGNANHGTPTGTTYAQGKIGKARNFNGSSDLISIGTGPSVKNLTQYSLESWFYVSTLPTAGNAMTIYKEHRNSDTTVRAKILVENASASYANVANSLTFRFRDTDAATAINVNTGANTISASKWYHVVVVYDSVGDTQKIFLNGQLISTATNTISAVSNTAPFSSNHLGDDAGSEFFNGQIDEVRVSNTARTASEIRQAYEIGLRTHPITIDFGAKLDSGNLITNSSDLSFTVDATYYGLTNMGDQLYLGDKIIVRENVDGTEYLAQGTVDSLTVNTGVTTVSAWDSGSTFPSGGFTVNASVFKWQREYWNVNNETLDTHLDAITNLTLRLTDGYEGRTIWLDDLRSNSESSGYLTTPSGSTITSAIGNRYLQYRMIMSSFDEAVSATLSAVTLDYTLNATPTTPSLDSPADTASNQSLTPVLKTTASDAESDYLRYKIELCTNLAMTTDCQTFDQTTSQSGWSGQNAQTSTAYTSATQATYTVQTALSANTTYYWRTYAIDPGGSNTWSATQSPARSFSTSTAPTAPTTPYAEGVGNPTNVIDLTPEFSAIHNDGDGDAAVYSEIEVNTNNTFTGTVMWDSGQTAMTSTANGVRSPDISYAGTALGYTGTTYYWRIRFTDNKGAVGAWSATQNFTLNIPPSVPTLDLPINTATDVIQYAVFKTTAADTDSDYLRYKIQLCTDLAMTTGCQTFDQTSSQTGWSGQNAQTSTAYTSGTQATYTLQTPLSTSTVYYWRSYAIDPAGSNTWSSTQATPFSFTTITAPEAATNCRIQENNTDTATTIVWTDVALTEDKYEVQRAVDGGAFAVLATNLAAGTTSYPDTTISQTHTYRYRVAPYFTTGPTYGSWCTTDTLSLQSGLFKFNGLNFNGIKLN